MDFSYFSKSSGITGQIKQSPEDFVVEEIISDGTILELNKEINLENKKEEPPKTNLSSFFS